MKNFFPRSLQPSDSPTRQGSRRAALLAFGLLLGLPLSRALAVDYTIAYSSNTITVTNSSGGADTLTVSEPAVGSVMFAAPGKSFTGSGTMGTSGSIPRGGFTSIVINGGNGGETFSVGALGGGSNLFPALTINGGTGNDTVNFTGNINFNSGYNLVVNLQNGSGSHGADTISVSNNAQILVAGTGSIDLECSRNISITGGANLQTVDGSLTLAANQQATATTGSFSGVYLDGSATRVQINGGGLLSVSGTGGNDTAGYQIGVDVEGGAQILHGNGPSGGGNLSVTGTGGASTGIVNRGVTVYGTGSAITCNSSLGSLGVTGSAGKLGSGYGIGVSVLSGGQISDAGDGTTIKGTGGGASGSSSNQGVEIGSASSAITSSYYVFVTATPGPGTSVGLTVATSAALGSSSTPEVNISTDSVSIDGTANITAGGAGIYFNTVTATHLNLGGNNAAGTLGLTAAELARVSSPYLFFQTGATGDLTVSAPITLTNQANVYLRPGSGGLVASASGVDLTVTGGTVFLQGALKMPITGTGASPVFAQFSVAGGVYLGGQISASLDLTGTTLAGSNGQTFTILAKDGTDAISGTFANLPEGTYLQWPTNTSLAAQISYKGGAGNDVTLTLVPVAQALTVSTTTASGVGSLQAVLNFAAARSGADNVTFASALNGGTITLNGPANGYAITVADSAGVTLDASGLSSGLTIAGGGSSGSFGLFQVNSGSTLTLRGLTLKNGGGRAFASGNGYGGAIYNSGTLTLAGCTLTGNSAYAGGAIDSSPDGTLTLSQCTLSGNSASGAGGAIENISGPLTLTQCTLSGNSSSQAGAIGNGGTLTIAQCTLSGNSTGTGSGAIDSFGLLSLANSIVAGNTGGGSDVYCPGPLFVFGANVVQSLSGSAPVGSGTVINAAPLLAPLGSYGGPIQTMPPLPGSPAIDHGDSMSIPLDPTTNVTFTVDQRGKPRIAGGSVDIGAVETSALRVTTAADDGTSGTLRSMVNAATDVTTTITFAPGLAGSTIPLAGAAGQIAPGKNIGIDANGLAGGITLTGAGASGNFRLLSVASGQTVFLRNLALANGGGSNFTSQGGALTNSGTLIASGCVFSGNAIANHAGNGGAIYNASGSSMTLTACTFANNYYNTGFYGGAGGAISNDGTMVVNASTFNGNTATSGGALLNNGTLTLSQCTLTANVANGTSGQGGALYNGAGSVGIVQCTVSLNSASSGGGIYNGSGTVTVNNSIVSGDTAGTGADLTNANAASNFVLTGANLIQGNSGSFSGSGTVNPNPPLLAPLGNYGGPTQTMALLPGSFARDNTRGSTINTDQRGFPISGNPDIGAYEAGDITNYNAWIYENLPASTSTNAAVHAATYDYDGDGASNYSEWLAQTSPTGVTSYLHITQTTRSGNNVSVTFPVLAGRKYFVETSPDLATWTTALTYSITGAGQQVATVATGGVPRFFVRVSVGAGP